MSHCHPHSHHLRLAVFASAFACAALVPPAHAAPVAAVEQAANAQRQPMLDTMRDLVNIESGSKDLEGLAKIAALIADRLKALGGQVELITPTDIYRMDDTPERVGQVVHAEFKGSGT